MTNSLPGSNSGSLIKGVALAVALAAVCMAAAPSLALALEPISSFTTTTSTTQAGGHPDLETSFKLSNPGSPEAARNVTFNAPTGIFGNSNAVNHCASADFALDQCPSSSQVGLITIYANYEGDDEDLLGTTPMYQMVPGVTEALFAFNVPMLNIPIEIPVSLRTESDFGLSFTVSNISEITPLAGADLTFWGFPALEVHDPQRFPKGSSGNPPGCVGLATTECLTGSVPAAIRIHPLTDNPTTCTAEPLLTSLEVETYQQPGEVSTSESDYPASTGCEAETFKPVLYASPTTESTDTASGLNVILQDPQYEDFAASPSELKAATVTLPEGFTINPDAADGQSECLESQAHFDSRGPAECPDNSKIGTFSIASAALEGPLEGSIYIGEPKPGDQYRLFMVASGFGINAKFHGSVKPNPETGQLTAYFNELPQDPFEEIRPPPVRR